MFLSDTAVDARIPVGLGQSQQLSKQEVLCVCVGWRGGVVVVVVVVIGEFSKWDFLEDSIKKFSRLFLNIHTHTFFSPWHLQLNFLHRITPTSVMWKSQIRLEA